jgi:hypothetical protein
MAITLKINDKPVTLDEFTTLLKRFCEHEYPIDDDLDGRPEHVVKWAVENNAEHAACIAAIEAATAQLYEDTTFVRLLDRWAHMLDEADEEDAQDYDCDPYENTYDPYDKPEAVAIAIHRILFG